MGVAYTEPRVANMAAEKKLSAVLENELEAIDKDCIRPIQVFKFHFKRVNKEMYFNNRSMPFSVVPSAVRIDQYHSQSFKTVSRTACVLYLRWRRG